MPEPKPQQQQGHPLGHSREPLSVKLMAVVTLAKRHGENSPEFNTAAVGLSEEEKLHLTAALRHFSMTVQQQRQQQQQQHQM